MNFTKLFYISTQKDLYSTKMTKLFSKLKLTKLFYIFPQQDQETIIRPEIFHNHTPKIYSQPNAQVYKGLMGERV